MKKVKVILGGLGAECYVHDITDEQKEHLINAGILDDKLNSDDICKIINKEWIEEDARIYLGAYSQSDNFYLAAYDEENNQIWASDDNFEFNDELSEDWWDGVEEEGNKLLIEDYVKGTFYTYNLQLEEDFDPQKLSGIFIEISETLQILKGLKYNGKDIEVFSVGDDYWSKGLYYHIYP